MTMTDNYTPTAEARYEALDEALAALDDLRRALDEAGLLQDDRFRAYHVAQLEGQESGWLGGPFLVDAIKEAFEQAREDALEARQTDR